MEDGYKLEIEDLYRGDNVLKVSLEKNIKELNDTGITSTENGRLMLTRRGTEASSIIKRSCKQYREKHPKILEGEKVKKDGYYQNGNDMILIKR